MDPNLFHLDWERTLEALVGIVVLAFLLERALSLLFESRWFICRFVEPLVSPDKEKGDEVLENEAPINKRARGITSRFPVRELIAFGTASLVCIWLGFDAPGIIFLQPEVTLWGEILTGAVVAGGSKASIALFHDVMGIRSSAQKERDAIRSARSGIKK